MNYSVFTNITLTTLILATIVVVVTTVLLTGRLQYLLYSGPWGLPFLGYYPFLGKNFPKQLAEMGKKYGDAYFLSMCGKRYLHVGSYKALREAVITNSASFPGRCRDFSILQYVFEEGLTFINAEAWKTWKKFLTQGMRELGLSMNRQLKGPLLDSVEATLDALQKSNGQPIDMGALLSVQSTEVVRRLMIGSKVSMETILKLNEEYFNANLLTGDLEILLAGSFARYFVLPWKKAFKKILTGKQNEDSILYNILNEHKANFDPDHAEDLIDLYIREKKIREVKTDPEAKYFTDQALVGTLIQVYGDGGFTTGSFITCCLKDIAPFLDIQNAIYEEISREIGTERFPTFEDRLHMPYTNAVIRELTRKSLFFPVIPSLENSRETTVSGLTVPKGTILLINVYAIHSDPSVYKDPERFDPDRFMVDEKTKRPKEELPVAFGIGKRSCAGEQLVISELFVFLTAILQRFTLYLEETEDADEKVTTAEIMEVLGCRIKAISRSDSH